MKSVPNVLAIGIPSLKFVAILAPWKLERWRAGFRFGGNAQRAGGLPCHVRKLNLRKIPLLVRVFGDESHFAGGIGLNAYVGIRFKSGGENQQGFRVLREEHGLQRAQLVGALDRKRHDGSESLRLMIARHESETFWLAVGCKYFQIDRIVWRLRRAARFGSARTNCLAGIVEHH